MAESTPLQFDVPDMERESCVALIKSAVRRVDPTAHVMADLHTKRVVVGSEASAPDIAEAISSAGFAVAAAK